MEDPLNYTLGDQLILEASSCKYLGIIIGSDLSWTDHVELHGEKGLEGTTFHNVYTQKGE